MYFWWTGSGLMCSCLHCSIAQSCFLFRAILHALLWVDTVCALIQVLATSWLWANRISKRRTQRKHGPCRQTTTRRVCVVFYVFTQTATRGTWYQLHLLPCSLFASEMAWLELACFSCPDCDWVIRYLRTALIGECYWNLRWAWD